MSIIDTAKDIYDLVKKGATVELQERIVQLPEEALTLQEENVNLKIRIKDLEQAIAIQQTLEWDGRLYWRQLPDSKDGPFCQRCYDSKKLILRLQPRRSDDRQFFICLDCKSSYWPRE